MFSAPDVCEAERFEAPGHVQPHAALLCLDSSLLTILSVSANIGELFPVFAGLAAGAHLPELPDEAIQSLGQAVAAPGGAHIEFVLSATHCPPRGAWAVAHRQGDVVYLELEPLEADDLELGAVLVQLRTTLSMIAATQTVADAASVLAEGVRLLTGMERVMVYRFDEFNDGEVVAEAVSPSLDVRFLHLHFPAADIPSRARQLYLRMPGRFSPQRSFEPSRLMPVAHPRTHAPFDIGRCYCRPLSPVHRQYLENLEVDSSMSLSIVENDNLWGLVIGHHRSAHRVTIKGRQLALALAVAFATHLGATEKSTERAEAALYQALHVNFLEQAAVAGNIYDFLASPDSRATKLFPGVCGMAVIHQLRGSPEAVSVQTSGIVPPAASIIHLAALTRPMLQDGFFITDRIRQAVGAFEDDDRAAGMLAITFGEDGAMLLLFAQEAAQVVEWGGASPEVIRQQKEQGVYLPRRSFSRWIEEYRERSMPWPRWVAELVPGLAKGLDGIARSLRPDIVEFRHRLEALTERERMVLVDIAMGQSTKAIAHKYGLSTRTVDGHRARIASKLGVTRASLLTRLAFESGLVGKQDIEWAHTAAQGVDASSS